MSTVRELLHKLMDLKELGNSSIEFTDEFNEFMSQVNKKQRIHISKIIFDLSQATHHAAYKEERICAHLNTKTEEILGDEFKEKCLDCMSYRIKSPNPARKRMFDVHNPAYVLSNWTY